MKRSVAILAIALAAAASGYSQVSLSGFQTAFTNFAGDMAGALALNSTIGSNWSDAYIGGFPHFGVGVVTGAAFTSSGGADSIFQAVGATEPDVLKNLNLGLPVPAVNATLKIGIPFLPMDVGIKGGYIPTSLGTNILGSGVNAQYTNIGLQVRYALIKQNILLPNLSVGASYNYQSGEISAPLPGTAATSYATPTPTVYHIFVSQPNLSLSWNSNVFDFTAQVSKLLLFFVPYAGVGYTVGTSSVTGGVKATVTTDYPGGDLNGLKNAIQAAGAPVPSIDANGFLYTADANTPVLRVYGGVSFRIVIVDLDAQVIYVPSTKALGGSFTARVQI